MSSPYVVVKQNPCLFPVKHEIAEFLMIGSWPRLLALRDSQAKLSRWDIANAKSSILQEMLSEELSEVWV